MVSNVAFHIQLVCDDDRKSICWLLSEGSFKKESVTQLLSAHRAIHDMQIRESALFVFQASGIEKGRVSETAALVPKAAVQTPVQTFLINDKLLTHIEGDSFLEKLLTLNTALDANSNEFQALLSALDAAHGLHCIAALGG